LPRLYRLLRILRLFKMVRLLKYNRTMKKLFNAIQMNAGIMRMLNLTVTVMFLVHLISCFWFLTCKLQDFAPDTWAVVFGLVEEGAGSQYITSMYWAFATLTTVGYGDIHATTTWERSISLVWMIFGVSFYSFTIGNLQSILSTIDVNH